MSQSESAFAASPSEPSGVSVTTVESQAEVQSLLDALGDADCRAILEATSEEALTAAEVSETIDLPKSTTYRKLETLSELDLLEEGTRVRRSGKHATEFNCRLEDLYLTTGSDGIELRVSRQRAAAAQQFGFSLPGAN
jgi:DNA-binding transcriptional ArsR family regulator